MSTDRSAGLLVLILLAAWLVLAIGAWKAERWFNWKFDYGRRVGERIEQLEKRVAALERGQ